MTTIAEGCYASVHRTLYVISKYETSILDVYKRVRMLIVRYINLRNSTVREVLFIHIMEQTRHIIKLKAFSFVGDDLTSKLRGLYRHTATSTFIFTKIYSLWLIINSTGNQGNENERECCNC